MGVTPLLYWCRVDYSIPIAKGEILEQKYAKKGESLSGDTYRCDQDEK